MLPGYVSMHIYSSVFYNYLSSYLYFIFLFSYSSISTLIYQNRVYTSDACGGFTASFMGAMQPAAFGGFKSGCIGILKPAALASWTADQVGLMREWGRVYIHCIMQVATLQPQACSGFTGTNIAQLNASAFAGIKTIVNQSTSYFFFLSFFLFVFKCFIPHLYSYLFIYAGFSQAQVASFTGVYSSDACAGLQPNQVMVCSLKLQFCKTLIFISLHLRHKLIYFSELTRRIICWAHTRMHQYIEFTGTQLDLSGATRQSHCKCCWR